MHTTRIRLRTIPAGLRYKSIVNRLQVRVDVMIHTEELPVAMIEGSLCDALVVDSSPIGFGIITANRLTLIQRLCGGDMSAGFNGALREVARRVTPPVLGLFDPSDELVNDEIIRDTGMKIVPLALSEMVTPEDSDPTKLYDPRHLDPLRSNVLDQLIHFPALENDERSNVKALWHSFLKSSDDWERSRIIFGFLRCLRRYLLKGLMVYAITIAESESESHSHSHSLSES